MQQTRHISILAHRDPPSVNYVLQQGCSHCLPLQPSLSVPTSPHVSWHWFISNSLIFAKLTDVLIYILKIMNEDTSKGRLSDLPSRPCGPCNPESSSQIPEWVLLHRDGTNRKNAQAARWASTEGHQGICFLVGWLGKRKVFFKNKIHNEFYC